MGKEEILGKKALEMLGFAPILLPNGLWYSTVQPGRSFFLSGITGWRKVFLFDQNVKPIEGSEEEISPVFNSGDDGFQYVGFRIMENGNARFYEAGTIEAPEPLKVLSKEALLLTKQSIITIDYDAFIYCNITDPAEKYPKYLLNQVNLAGSLVNPHILKICGVDAYLFPIGKPSFHKRELKTSEIGFFGNNCEEINLKTPYNCELIMGEPEPEE